MNDRLGRILLVLLLIALSVGGQRTIYRNSSQSIALRPLTLDPANPGTRRVGDLIFLQAWELVSDNGDFGGISALAVQPDGRFIGISDTGTLIGFGLTSDGRAKGSSIAPLPESHGPQKSFRDRDSEGIAYNPENGQFWVVYEGRHAIRRFDPSFTRSIGSARPPEMQAWPSNKGAETIVRMANGRFVVIAETLEAEAHPALLFSGDPVERGSSVVPFSFRPPTGYRVTDGAMLPDGRMLILNRSIGFPKGFAAKLAIVEPIQIARGAVVDGQVIATLASPLLIDNMEGLAVTRQGADVIVWIISDNNFNIWQRTLLMKFQLSERRPKKKPEALPAPGFDSL